MTDAVFGLLGVLVGGAITGWTTYALEPAGSARPHVSRRGSSERTCCPECSCSKMC